MLKLPNSLANSPISSLLFAAVFFAWPALKAQSTGKPNQVTVDWNKTVMVPIAARACVSLP